jgi:hypothetical protein
MGNIAFNLKNTFIVKKADDLKPTQKKLISDDNDDNSQSGVSTFDVTIFMSL